MFLAILKKNKNKHFWRLKYSGMLTHECTHLHGQTVQEEVSFLDCQNLNIGLWQSSGTINQWTQCNIPHDLNLHQQYCGNLKCCIFNSQVINIYRGSYDHKNPFVNKNKN